MKIKIIKRCQIYLPLLAITLLALIFSACAVPNPAATRTPLPSTAPEGIPEEWEISETLLVEIDFDAVFELSAASPDARRFGFPTEVGFERRYGRLPSSARTASVRLISRK
jgi:hypothetical protein